MTAIIVLGTGRCGTSAVAGVLHHLGVFMGEGPFVPTPDNAKGSFEDVEFWNLHMEMIGGDWKRPVVALGGGILERYKALVQKRQKEHELWGLKDPRLCYTFPVLTWFAKDIRVICPFREDVAILRSLMRTAEIHSEQEAELILERYRFALWQSTEFIEMLDRPVLRVEYNKLIDDPFVWVHHIAGFVDTDVTQAAIDFIDPKLRHW